MEQQLFAPPTYQFRTVPLATIRPPETSGAVNRTGDAMAVLGAADPITVLELESLTPEGYLYDVRDGSRRYESAVAIGLEKYPVVVVPNGTDTAALDALRVVLNMNRAPNPLHEADALASLCRNKKVTPARVATLLGIPKQTVEKRLALAGLPSEIKTAITEGRMAVGTAQHVARMPEDQQEQVVALLSVLNGRITMNDVRGIRRVAVEQVVATLPPALFETPSVPAEQPTDGKAEVRLAGMPATPEQLLATAVQRLKDAGTTQRDIRTMVRDAWRGANDG